MKPYIRWTLLLITIAVLLQLFLIRLDLNFNKKSTPPPVINKISPGLPISLTIPRINVNAAIQHLGVTDSGKLDVPNDSIDVGWFKLGPRPGEKGNAVIDGHFDEVNGEAGVFFNLYKLKKGDKLYIKDTKGATITFVVRESRIYGTEDAEDVFNSSDGNAHLNLITCDGVWDGAKKNYTERLVVFADIVN